RIVPRAPSAAPLRQVAAARSSARRFHRELPSAPELEEPWTTRGPRRGARPHCLAREPTQFGRGCAARTARNKSISLNKMSGGGGNRTRVRKHSPFWLYMLVPRFVVIRRIEHG